MSNKIKCTCGHSWNKSSSSKKDMNICHICGKDTTMQMGGFVYPVNYVPQKENGGWLDKFDVPEAQNGIEGTMGGLTDKGFNYNGAWGGPSMQMGGAMPGSVGFTYARTKGIPSEGPYAKKTMPSAQDGIISSLSSVPLNLLNKALGLFGNQPNKVPQVPQKEVVPLTLNVFDKMSQKYNEKYKSFYDKWEANNKLDPENKSKNPVVLNTGRFRGARVEPTMIDDLIKAAKLQGVDPWLMVALAGRESTFGSGTAANKDRYTHKDRIVSGWTVTEGYVPPTIASFLADKKVPGANTYKSSIGWTYDIDRGQIKSVEDYLNNHPEIVQSYYKQLEKTPDVGNLGGYDLAAKRIKEKGLKSYNPGDPNYSKLVMDDMSKLKSDKAMAAYMKSRGFKNGGEMKFYQEGLDWKPRNISRDGSEIPQAQLGLHMLTPDYNQVGENIMEMLSVPQKALTKLFSGKYQAPSEALGIKNKAGAIATDILLDPMNLMGAGVVAKASTETGALSKAYKYNPWAFKPNPEAGYRMIGGKEGYLDAITSGQIRPTGAYEHAHFNIGQPLNPNRLSAEELIQAGSPGGYKGPYMAEMQQGTWQRMSDAFPNNPEMQEQFRLLGKDKDVWQNPLFGNIKVDDPRLKLYKENWLKGYKEVPKPKKKEEGGEITKDDNGYWNPENWGKPVEIGSNEITMQGVYEPLLGISDTGDVQMMYPGEDYTFDGESVTEYPVAQKGISVSKPTAADSLALYNNSMELLKYYGNLKKYKDVGAENTNLGTSAITSTNMASMKDMAARLRNSEYPITSRTSSIVNPADEDFTIADYYGRFKDNPYKYKQRETANNILDLDAPFILYDTRIAPNKSYNFENIKKGNSLRANPLFGDLVSFYGYDPIAVKPYDMRTPQEKIEWEKKYGKPTQKQPPVKTPPPPVKTQKPQVDQFGLVRDDYIQARKGKFTLTPGNDKGDGYYELKKDGKSYKVYTESGGNSWVDVPKKTTSVKKPVTKPTPKKEQPAKQVEKPQPKQEVVKKQEPKPQPVIQKEQLKPIEKLEVKKEEPKLPYRVDYKGGSKYFASDKEGAEYIKQLNKDFMENKIPNPGSVSGYYETKKKNGGWLEKYK